MKVGWSHYHTTLILNRGAVHLQLLRQKAPKGLSINQRHCPLISGTRFGGDHSTILRVSGKQESVPV
jgi:hypothetical protein